MIVHANKRYNMKTKLIYVWDNHINTKKVWDYVTKIVWVLLLGVWFYFAIYKQFY